MHYFKKFLRKKTDWGIDLSLLAFTLAAVFHRILDFKNGAGSLSWPLFYCKTLL